MCELEVDASASRYNEDLIRIHDQLSSSDFKTLKFLCKGIVPLCTLESMESALDLFTELERQNKISNSPYNVEFLAKLLLLIGRKDLVKRFLVSAGESSETNIDPFR